MITPVIWRVEDIFLDLGIIFSNRFLLGNGKERKSAPKSTNESGEDPEFEGLREAVVDPIDWSEEDDEQSSSERKGEKEE